MKRNIKIQFITEEDFIRTIILAGKKISFLHVDFLCLLQELSPFLCLLRVFISK